MKIDLKQITLIPECQPRVELSSSTIKEYTQAMREGDMFPPLSVIQDKGKYYLWDGWHRYHAHKKAGTEKVEVVVTQGAARDAILLSVTANAEHGMRRTNRDKYRAVIRLLGDDEWRKWSDHEIAKQCRVSRPFVGKIRSEVTSNITSDNSESTSPPAPNERTYIDKHGYTSTMAVANIGKRSDVEPKPEPFTLSEPEPDKRLEIASSKATFNATNQQTIGWVDWTWNPVTGCKQGCAYCYAKEISMRFNGPDGFKPTFHAERLAAPQNTNPKMNTPGGHKVFVCSMADLFGTWVPNEWIDKVMQAVCDAPQWTFLFLTKNPARLTSIQWPDNAWVGATVDTQDRAKPTEQAMRKVNAAIRFISVEPMLTPIVFEELSWCDWVIIGAQSAANGLPEFQPEVAWHEALTTQATAAGCAVYHKANLRMRRMEWPPCGSPP